MLLNIFSLNFYTINYYSIFKIKLQHIHSYNIIKLLKKVKKRINSFEL